MKPYQIEFNFLFNLIWPFEFKYVLVSIAIIKKINFHMWWLKGDDIKKKSKYEKVSLWNCEVGNLL